jgi:hypothetical protein
MARNVPDSSNTTDANTGVTDGVPNGMRRNDRDLPATGVSPNRTSGSSVPDEPGAEVIQMAQVITPEDRVRWGPVWAGLLTTLTLFLVLELLAYGLGLLTSNNNGTVGASGAAPWITGVLGLIAFFVGGYVAEWAAAARDGGSGLLNGFIVWALATSLILVLSILGLGSLFGALGTAIGQFLAAGGHVSAPGGVSVSGNQVANVTQSAALGAFFSLVLTAIAAAVGGLLGSPGRAAGFTRHRR